MAGRRARRRHIGSGAVAPAQRELAPERFRGLLRLHDDGPLDAGLRGDARVPGGPEFLAAQRVRRADVRVALVVEGAHGVPRGTFRSVFALGAPFVALFRSPLGVLDHEQRRASLDGPEGDLPGVLYGVEVAVYVQLRR